VYRILKVVLVGFYHEILLQHMRTKESNEVFTYTECFTTCGHYCKRWFPRSL